VPSSKPKPWLSLAVAWGYPTQQQLTIDYEVLGDAVGLRANDALARVADALRAYASAGSGWSGPAGFTLGTGGHDLVSVVPFEDPVNQPDVQANRLLTEHFERLKDGKGPWLPRR
jgi:hypothetical protein